MGIGHEEKTTGLYWGNDCDGGLHNRMCGGTGCSGEGKYIRGGGNHAAPAYGNSVADSDAGAGV